jgi:hypothetical protein
MAALAPLLFLALRLVAAQPIQRRQLGGAWLYKQSRAIAHNPR